MEAGFTGGSVRTLRTKGWASAPYAPTVPDKRTDAEIMVLIESTITRWRSHPSLPPMDVLLRVYKEAWMHHKGPRRKRRTPNLFPDKWALQEVGRVCEVWVSGRRDAFGAWQQYAHIAAFDTHVIHEDTAPVPPPPAPPPPAVTPEPEKKLHWKVREKMEREAAAKAAAVTAPPPPPQPRMSPEARAKARAEAILRAGGTSRAAD